MSVLSVLWVGQRVTAHGIEGVVSAVDVPYEHAKGVRVWVEWDPSDPEGRRDYRSYNLTFPYSQVRPL